MHHVPAISIPLSQRTVIVKRIAIALVVVCGLGYSSPAVAQTCAGGPSFAAGPAHASYGLGLSSNATGNQGTIAGGNDKVFGGGGIGATNMDIDGVTGTGLAFTGGFGVQVHDAREQVFVCPGVSLTYVNGPQVLGFDTATALVEGGVNVGIVAAKTASVTVIPTAGGSVVRQRVSLKDLDGFDVSETYGLATFGIGFVLHERFAFVPAISVPVGLDGGKPSFVLSLTAAFGR
jgi:hypothetical protein